MALDFETRVTSVIRMWAEGASSGVIAATLGITRGVVAGIVHRAKQKGLAENKTIPKVKLPRRPVQTPAAGTRQPEVAKDGTGFILPSYKPKPNRPRPPHKGVNILALTDRSCRWCEDGHDADGLPLYCGEPTDEGKSYCSEHHHIVYVPVRPITPRKNFVRPKIFY